MREPILYNYLDDRCSPLPQYLLDIERNTFLHALSPQMISGHMQGRFLAWLVSWLSPKHVLEVGSFTGYGAVCFAERLPKDGLVTTIEINDELEALIHRNVELAGFSESVNVLIGDANSLIPTLTGTFDLVYLDAKKDDYPKQFEMVAEKLAPKGHILLDNVLWDGQVIDPKKNHETTKLLREFTRSLAQNPQWETLMLPMSDGLMLVRSADQFLPTTSR